MADVDSITRSDSGPVWRGPAPVVPAGRLCRVAESVSHGRWRVDQSLPTHVDQSMPTHRTPYFPPYSLSLNLIASQSAISDRDSAEAGAVLLVGIQETVNCHSLQSLCSSGFLWVHHRFAALVVKSIKKINPHVYSRQAGDKGYCQTSFRKYFKTAVSRPSQSSVRIAGVSTHTLFSASACRKGTLLIKDNSPGVPSPFCTT